MFRRSILFAALAVPLLVLVACARSNSGDKWADHRGNIPFQVGDIDTGLAASRATGRPPAYFFTATW